MSAPYPLFLPHTHTPPVHRSAEYIIKFNTSHRWKRIYIFIITVHFSIISFFSFDHSCIHIRGGASWRISHSNHLAPCPMSESKRWNWNEFSKQKFFFGVVSNWCTSCTSHYLFFSGMGTWAWMRTSSDDHAESYSFYDFSFLDCIVCTCSTANTTSTILISFYFHFCHFQWLSMQAFPSLRPSARHLALTGRLQKCKNFSSPEFIFFALLGRVAFNENASARK